ncbi:hypothetical protein quinque_014054 [Culex quinquefasciatus]
MTSKDSSRICCSVFPDCGKNCRKSSRKPAFLSTFTLAAEQSNKLGLGKNRNIISVYADCIVIQMNKLPFVVTFIGTENCLNIGLILAMDQQIDTMLEELKTAVADS